MGLPTLNYFYSISFGEEYKKTRSCSLGAVVALILAYLLRKTAILLLKCAHLLPLVKD